MGKTGLESLEEGSMNGHLLPRRLPNEEMDSSEESSDEEEEESEHSEQEFEESTSDKS